MSAKGRVSCGLDIDFSDDLEESIENSSRNGYDFICTNVVRQGCAPLETASLRDRIGGITDTSFLFNSQEWASLVVGKLSLLPDLTSVITKNRLLAEEAVRQELRFVAFLSLPAIVVEVNSENCSNVARIIYSHLHEGHHNTHIWVKVPLQSEGQDTWKWWNKFRTLCNHHGRVGLALEMTSDLPPQLERWPGEPIRVLYIPTSVFLTNKKGYPVLSRAHQHFVMALFKLNCQIVLSGRNLDHADGIVVYHQYLDHLFQAFTSKNAGQYEQFARGYEDYLQAPLQPLMDNLESSTYEIFEKDPIKYDKYEEAVYHCLLDIVPDSVAEQQTVVIMVLGAGRGPLVRMSLKGARRANRKVRIYAVEKNKNAAVLLEHLKNTEWRADDVTVVSADMRSWNAPELADIVVSELLGSFGDNELSPECLDGANRFLKPNAVSIPQSYTSYLSPISSHKLFNEIRGITALEKNKSPESSFEMPYVVRIHNYHELTNPIPLFTFNHPNWNANSENPKPEFFDEISPGKWEEKFSPKERNDSIIENDAVMQVNHLSDDFTSLTKTDNQAAVSVPSNSHNTRYQQSLFHIPFDTVLHGFAGYFRCSLYKNVEISTEPKTHSPGMFSWFPIFFPLLNPIPLQEGSTLKVDFWRCSDEKKVWYEWCTAAPQASVIHNSNGKSYTIGL